MKRFDHTKFPLPAKGLSPVPNHGVAWKHKYANWWGGATIASPTRDIAYMAQAERNFRALDEDEKGYLTLADLPLTKIQVMMGARKGRKGRR